MNRKILFLTVVLLGLTAPVQAKSTSHAKKLGGLFSPGAMDVSGTAGVRGGDVMGDAIKRASPNSGAVTEMEQRSVASEKLTNFQREGKIGPYAK